MLPGNDYFDPYLEERRTTTAPALLLADHRVCRPMGGLDYVWSAAPVLGDRGMAEHLAGRLIGERLFRKGAGLITGWISATTFYFLFWAARGHGGCAHRVWRAGGGVVVLARAGPHLGRYGISCAGDVAVQGAVVCTAGPGTAAAAQRTALQTPPATAPGAGAADRCGVSTPSLVLSHLYGAPTYGESGLRRWCSAENVVRFFDPFDHMEMISTTLIYLPAYTLPWAPCWLLGLWLAVQHLRQPPGFPNVRWLVWGTGPRCCVLHRQR